MGDGTLLEGVNSETVTTSRLATHLLTSGPEEGVSLLFVHGNTSSGRFFEDTLAALPNRYRGFALDLRGFGGSESKPLDATRGIADFSDDLAALVDALMLGPVHLVGWSVGGAVAMRYAMDRPGGVASLVLINPLSPYGYGGTKDADGSPCWPDYAGSGGGTANPVFVRRLARGDRGEKDLNSPRNVMNKLYFKPPFRAAPDREEAYLDAILSTRIGKNNYPGDATASRNWPHTAPGTRGMSNAISPKYCNLSAFANMDTKPDVLWLRGASDAVVSDASLLDLGTLGRLGFVEGWPGRKVYPPQPMVSQTRAVLDAYRRNGGRYREEVIAGCGHTPHVEKPGEFRRRLFAFLERH